MTWIWATLLLVLAAPFVLWPLIRAEPPGPWPELSVESAAPDPGGPAPDPPAD